MRTSIRPWSLTELAAATDEPERRVKDAMRELRNEGLIEFVGTGSGPKGHAVRLYRATRFTIDAAEFSDLAPSAKAASSASIVRLLQGEIARALQAESFYAHPHHVLMRDRRVVDDEGMRKIDEAFNRAHDAVVEAEQESAKRLATSDENGHSIGVGLIAFSVAPEDRGSEKSDS